MNKDRTVGIAFILIAALFLFMSGQLPKSKYSTVVGASVFPTIASGGLLLCGAALALKRDKNKKKAIPFLGRDGWMRVAKLVILLAVFPFAFNFLGFLVSAFILLALMIRMFDMEGEVSLWKAVLLAAVITGAIYGVFVVLLKTQLPAGALFELMGGQ